MSILVYGDINQLPTKVRRVALVAGGLEYELEDVEKSRTDVLDALEKLGCQVLEVSLRKSPFLQSLMDAKPQVCFIIDPFYTVPENGGRPVVRDVRVLLDQLMLPYTGSPPVAAALCKDKIRSKQQFRSLGVATPFDLDVPPQPCREWIAKACEELRLPLILKPRHEGAGVGVCLCANIEEIASKIATLQSDYPELMVEEYIAGTEITIGVVGLIN